MREYEVMSVQTPTQVRRPSFANFEFEDNSSPEHLFPPTTTTLVLREKHSFLRTLLQNCTLSSFSRLRVNDTGGDGVRREWSSLRRQSPEMRHRQRVIVLIFLLLSLVLILLLTTILEFHGPTLLTSQSLGLTLDLEKLGEREKCPACFGVNLCPQVVGGEIELNDWNRFTMASLLNVKNVFYGTWMDKGREKQVVLKKFGHDSELDELDSLICEHRGGGGSCDVSDKVRALIEDYKLETENPFRPLLNGEKLSKGSDLLLCPSHHKMDVVIRAASNFNRAQHHLTVLAQVLTMLLLNPEPLILNTFPKSDGWPFPEYYGACGRLGVEEYVGRTLSDFYQERFEVRADLALKLLLLAKDFNEKSPEFIIYLTDITPDNFAVAEDDSNRLAAIDLENFIIVDRDKLDRKSESSSKVLVGESSRCNADTKGDNSMCFSFITEDLCTRPLTDHNYYTICAGILADEALAEERSQGLLHSLPIEFSTDSRLSSFSEVLLKCKDPKLGRGDLELNRIQAAHDLMQLLNVYLNKTEKNQEQLNKYNFH